MTDRKLRALKERLGSYVKERERAYIKWLKTQDIEVSKKIKRILKRTSDEILKETTMLMLKYAGVDGNISMAKMSLIVSQSDMQELAEKAKYYVEQASNKNFTKAFSDTANAEMRQYNLTMRVSRQELLRRYLNLEINKMTNDVNSVLSTYLEDLTVKELQRQAGILNSNISSPESLTNKAKVIANADFHGQTFRQRLWKNSANLAQNIEIGIAKTMLQGKNPKTWAKLFKSELQDNINNAQYVMERLAVTESARAQVQAQEDSYKRNGFTQYEIITEPDACEICIAHDGKIYWTTDFKIGINAPVWHPNCRCTTTPYVAEEEIEQAINELESYNQMSDEELYNAIIEKLEKGEYKTPEGMELFKGDYFEDITNAFKKSKNNKNKHVKDIREITIDGIKYKVDDKNVKLDYSPEERATAEYLSEKIGGEVLMHPRIINTKGFRTPDYLWDNEKWDLKVIKGHGRNTVTTAIGNAKNQADNIVLNFINDNYSLKDKLNEVERIFGSSRYSFIDKILILEKNKLVGIFRRK